jgi:hypothetical protein
MTREMWIYLILVLYLAIVLGLAIRCVDEHAPALIVLLPIIPLFIVILNIILSLEITIESKKSMHNKIKYLILSLIYGVQELPIFLGFTVKILARSTLNKSLESVMLKLFDIRAIKRQITNFYSLYASFFTTRLKKNKSQIYRYN